MSADKALLSGHRTWTFYQTFDSNKNTSSIFGTHEPFFKHRPAGLRPLLFWGSTYCRKHPWNFIDMMGMSLVETERCWTCDIGSTSSVGVGWCLRPLMRTSMDLQVAASKPWWGNYKLIFGCHHAQIHVCFPSNLQSSSAKRIHLPHKKSTKCQHLCALKLHTPQVEHRTSKWQEIRRCQS